MECDYEFNYVIMFKNTEKKLIFQGHKNETQLLALNFIENNNNLRRKRKCF